MDASLLPMLPLPPPPGLWNSKGAMQRNNPPPMPPGHAERPRNQARPEEQKDDSKGEAADNAAEQEQAAPHPVSPQQQSAAPEQVDAPADNAPAENIPPRQPDIIEPLKQPRDKSREQKKHPTEKKSSSKQAPAPVAGSEMAQNPPAEENNGRPRRAAAQHKGWIHGRHNDSHLYTGLHHPADFYPVGGMYQDHSQPLLVRIQLANYFSYYGDLHRADSLLAAHLDHVETIRAYRVSFTEALKMTDRLAEIEAAIVDEIHNMEQNHVVKAVKTEDITPEKRRRCVPSHMFLKFKYKADGAFDKVKARLVANGDRQAPDTIGKTFSPTVNTISVKTHLQLTVTDAMHLHAYDIKGAFLLSKMRKRSGEMIYIRVPANVVKYWRKLYPKYTDEYVAKDGSMTFQLEKYIYGLAESPSKFNELFDTTIKSHGFRQLHADNCMYIRDTKRGQIIVSVHVDDMLMSCTSLEDRDWFERKMAKSFDMVAQRGKSISYLGMNIQYDRKARTLRISQEGMITELLKKYGCENIKKPPSTPALPTIFDDPSLDDDNSEVSQKDFLSLVMTLMYIGRFTRHDILHAVTVLATRSACPRKSDMSHAMRIVRYLSGTRNIGPTFDGNVPLDPAISADASHNVHHTGHGHAGIVITLGSAPIHCQSYKLKLVTRSSSESELVVLEEASTYAVWLKLLLTEVKKMKKTDKVRIYQDNMSTMIIAEGGKGNFKRTKHLLAREAFVKERIEEGDIILTYKPTEDMSADFLTKPLSRPKLMKHLSSLKMTGR
jgi:hypothetical protein